MTNLRRSSTEKCIVAGLWRMLAERKVFSSYWKESFASASITILNYSMHCKRGKKKLKFGSKLDRASVFAPRCCAICATKQHQMPPPQWPVTGTLMPTALLGCGFTYGLGVLGDKALFPRQITRPVQSFLILTDNGCMKCEPVIRSALGMPRRTICPF